MKHKRIIFIFSLILVLLLGLSLRPSFSIVSADVNYNNYYYKSKNVELTIYENNTYYVTETMQVQFGSPSDGKHKGIVRYIPNTQTISFNEKGKTKKQKYYCTISEITGNEIYNTYKSGNYTVIELGGDNYVNGYDTTTSDRLITYTINYKFNIGNDFVKDYDLFVFNLMGEQEPVKTEEFTFSIHFPKSIDVVPTFYKGLYGANDTSEIPYVYNNETLTLSSVGSTSFEPYEALTVKMNFPKGYYTKSQGFHIGVEIGVLVGSIILTMVIIFVAIDMANKNKPIRVVEFYPPEGYTPCDCDYVINGKFSPKRLVSLVLYWASKGIVKINNDTNNKPVSITKLKELDDKAKIYEKDLFKAFFPNEEKTTYELSKTDTNISGVMNTCSEDVKNLIGDRYKSSSKTSHFLMGLISFIPYVIMLVAVHIRTKSMGPSIPVIIATVVISFVAMSLWGSTYFIEDDDHKLNIARVGAIMMMIVVLVINIISIPRGYDLMFGRIYTLLPVVVYVVLGKNMFSMTAEMKSVYGRLWGFKHSITIMEKSRIERLVKEDPSYFYNILPYAYALNVLDDFVKNFEKIYIPTAQNAYISPLNAYMLCNSLNNTFTAMAVATGVTRTYSKIGMSGGRGGFGGGFSGGGFGGGGSHGR